MGDGAVLALTAGGVTVLIDASAGRLPVITYWGPALPDLDAGQAATIIAANVPVAGTNNLEPPPRLAVLPGHHTGWTGRPGLRGSFAGVGWSLAFLTTSVSVGGVPVDGFVSAGAASVEVQAIDDGARLQLRLILELLPSGMLRARAAIRNLAPEVYTLDDLVLSFPVPDEATELLDFAGRHNWNGCRSAVRFRPARTSARTARAAPAPTAPTCCTPAQPVSASARVACGRCTRPGAGTTRTARSGSSPANS
jgi:alpha-galactosidase